MRCALCGEEYTIETTIVPDYLLDEQENKDSNRIYFCVDHHDKFKEGYIGICLNRTNFIVKIGNSYHSQPTEYELSNLSEEYIQIANKDCERRIRMKLGIVDIPGSDHWCNG